MSGHAEAINAKITAKTTIVTGSGVGAAGASSIPTSAYGEFLTTHGIWLLSYAEWIQVISATYVLTLLVKSAVIPLAKLIIDRIKS